MTTTVIVLNQGPDAISVAPVNDAGELFGTEYERQTIQPGCFSKPILVYDNHHVHAAELKPSSEPKP